MKRLDLKKALFLRRTLSQLFTSFKRAFSVVNGESTSSDSQVSLRRNPFGFLTYDEYQRINTQLVEMARHKAEAIQFMREQTRNA